jgi:hypothetical protein
MHCTLIFCYISYITYKASNCYYSICSPQSILIYLYIHLLVNYITQPYHFKLQNAETLMYDEMQIILMEAVVVCFRHYPCDRTEGTEENHEKSQSRQSVSRQVYKSDSSCYVTNKPASPVVMLSNGHTKNFTNLS